MFLYQNLFFYNYAFDYRRLLVDTVSAKGCVCPSVRPSDRLFPLYLLNELTFDVDFCMCMGHHHSSPGLKVKG